MTQTKARGRKPLPQDRKQSKQVLVRMTPTRYDEIKRQADGNGLLITDYIRERLYCTV